MVTEIMINPTSNSNWLINNVLLCGGTPASLESLVEVGIDVIICLQTLKELKELKEKGSNTNLDIAQKVEWYNFPIVDGKTADDEKVVRWCHMILDLVYRGKKVYLHCLGGHGRTGTISACLLQLLGMKPHEALQYVDHLHSTRMKGCDVPSPSTQEQVQQVQRFMKIPYTVLVCGEWDDEDIIRRELGRFGPNVTVIIQSEDGVFESVCESVCDELGLECVTIIDKYKPLIVLEFHKSSREAITTNTFTRIIVN